MDTAKTPGIKEFKPKCEEHVKWLQRLDAILIGMMRADPGSSKPSAQRMGLVLKSNPFGVTMPIEAFIDIHAGMSIIYASHVLSGDAWIPPTGSH
mgnify:FL=1